MKSTILFTLLLMLRTCLTAQVFPLHTYTTKDGLPSNHITALFQDSRRYLWVGTDNGLSMYDGTEFRNFSTKDGLPNLFITDILESSHDPGTYWIGTIAGGLVKLRNGHFSSLHIGDNNVGNLFEDADGIVWCSSGNREYRIASDSVIVAGPADTLHTSIHGFGADGVLTTTSRAIIRQRRDGSPEWIRTLSLGRKECIFATTVDREGVFWAIGSRGTIVQMRDSVVEYYHVSMPLSFDPNIPSHLADDGRGFLWINTNEGVALIDKNDPTIRLLGDLDKQIEKYSGAVLCDCEGTLWIGTYADGLLKITDRRISLFQISDVSEGAYNLAACSDSNGHIWISTESGIYEALRSNNHTWKVFQHRLGGPRWTPAALLVDPRNRLWVGPIRQERPYSCFGITYRTDTASILTPVMALRIELIDPRGTGLTFAVDQSSRGWFVTRSGIVQTDLTTRKVLRVFGFEGGLPTDPIRALLVDRSGTVWAGSWTEGLAASISGSDSFKIVKEFSEFAGAGVRSLFEDHGGTIWIGTRYGGLVRDKDGQCTGVSINDGMLSNAIWSIAETDHDIWCGTDVGLEVVDKATYKVLPPKAELIGKRVYACGAYRNAFVWCVRRNELLIFEQPEHRVNTEPPPVYIKRYAVNGIEIPPAGPHKLDYHQNSCTIDFVGVSLRDEQSVRYQYRMLGHDSAWGYPVQSHSVTYASLSPGVYRFEVRALTAEGTASMTPGFLSFEIVPPMWQRWWFAVGLTVLGASVVYSLFRYRLYHLLKLEGLRLRIARDLHDDVGTNLSSIMVASQIMEKKFSLSEQERSQLRDVGAIAASTQEMMKDIVWVLNPRNDRLDNFLLRMKEIAARLLESVPYTFTVSQEKLLEKVSIEFKRNVFLIFKEALNNILRHASATAVSLSAIEEKGVFTLTVEDNGRGFDAARVAPGVGLESLRTRAEEIHGRLDIHSVVGCGTMIRLTVKIT